MSLVNYFYVTLFTKIKHFKLVLEKNKILI